MEIAFQKTIVFIVFIFIGILLKFKFKTKDEVSGIKKIILNLALPATIFIALLGVKIKLNLLLLPLLALVLNLLLFWGFPYILPLLGVKKGKPEFRTARILLPSLAPGLSCFPFVLEFLGEDYLAMAAMSDLGNKIFVLLFLYLVAMRWYFGIHEKKQENGLTKLKSMFKVMVTEPVNLFIVAALVLLGLGITMDSIPFIIREPLQKLSVIMTPLVLLFIGLAVRIKRKQFFQIFSILILRAGVVFLLCGIFIVITGMQSMNLILLMLAFGSSACSFWPYAHIASVESLEKETERKTFQSNFAINILALSFPLSTILVLGILNSGTTLSAPINIFLVAIFLMLLGLLLPITQRLGKALKRNKLVTSKLSSPRTEHV